MSFVLDIDGPRWRAHLDAVVSASPDLVPVIKGNGYGLGQDLLAGEARRLGLGTVAVGTVMEAVDLVDDGHTDVLVLQPFDPRDDAAGAAWWSLAQSGRADRLIRTIASAESLAALAQGPGRTRVVLEGLTSMWRFGFEDRALRSALDHLSDSVSIEGLAVHLPLTDRGDTPRIAQALTWGRRWQELIDERGLAESARQLWVSHLPSASVADVAAQLPALRVRPRIGTQLWHGDRDCLRASGTVLAVHPLDSSTAVGYRQRRGRGTLLVVSGGTSHGVGLEAPISATSTRQRLGAIGSGAVEATGRSLSPFRWTGKQRWFAEPPHMHVSLLWLPKGSVVPAIGDQLDAVVRFTTSHFDEVRVHEG